MLGALRSRDYRLFWSGSFIANLGVWVQQIALVMIALAGVAVLRRAPALTAARA